MKYYIPIEQGVGCIVWSNRRLRYYLFSVIFSVFTDHECLQLIRKIGETKPRTQRWMEFLSAYEFTLLYCCGRDNANADFLSRLPLPPPEEDISVSCALSDLDDFGVHLIRAYGLMPFSCPIPGIVMSGILFTQIDFHTNRAPFLPPHMVRSIDRPHLMFTGN